MLMGFIMKNAARSLRMMSGDSVFLLFLPDESIRTHMN